MSEAMLYEDYIRQQIERGSCGVAIIPATIAEGIAEWIEKQREKKTTHEQAIDCLTESGWMKEHDRQMMLDGVRKYAVVSNQPTIDAVPVVRCKDCKHRHKITCAFLIANCMKTGDDNDFCSRGERKDDE